MVPDGDRGLPEDDDDAFEVVIRDRGDAASSAYLPATEPVVYGSYGGGYLVPLDEVRRQVTERRQRVAALEEGRP